MPDGALSLGRFLGALRRRWKVAVASAFAASVIGGVAAYLVVPPAKYSSRATLHVSTNPKYIIFDPKERFADYRTYQRTQVAMARSLFVLGDALKDARIAGLRTIAAQNDPIEWLAKAIKVDFPDASEVLEISLSGEHAGELEVLVNAVVDSYLRLVVDEEQQERKGRLEKLRVLWQRYQENLQAKRADMRRLTESIGSNDKQVLTMAHQSKIQNRDFAEQEHLRVSFELRKAEAELAVLEARAEAAEHEAVPPRLVEERIGADEAVQQIEQKIKSFSASYLQARRLSRAEHDPAVTAPLQHLEAARKDLAARREGLRPAIVAGIRESSRKDDGGEIAKLRAQVSVSKMYMGAIEKDLERLKGESQTISRGSMDLSQHQDELQIVGDTAHKIGAEVEAMEVELGAPPRVRIVDRATAPGRKDELRKVKAGLAGGVGSFSAVLLLVAFWECRARRIDSIDQVVEGLRLRIVGSLPIVRIPPTRRGLALDGRVLEQFLESIDATRTMLLYAAGLDGNRCVMITSAVQGEGKTSLAAHLATSLARTGRRTLLVDGDLRNSSAHKLFDLPLGPGLSEVMRGELGIDRAIRTTSADGLHLLPAGRCDASAIQALSQEGARAFFDELKARYDFVVVDSAPVLPLADSLLFCQLVDVVIFSILRDVSRVPMVHAAHQRLSSLGVKILGAVVSGTPLGPREYGYPHGDKTPGPDAAYARGRDRA